VSKKIAFFDFDGTITYKDTLLEFIRYTKGNLRFLLGFGINSPYILAYKLGIISNQKAKEKVLRFFFRNTSESEFLEYCKSFSLKALNNLIRPKALEEVKRLKNEGYEVVVVSASPENWIQFWTEQNNLKLIASKLIIQNGKLTGQINGQNCHGIEKVNRIKEVFNLNEYNEIIAYGDTSGDIPMLNLASRSLYKPFRN
jgi:phosphatidylglycerophosphatase C